MWTAAFVVVGLWSAPGAQLTMSYCTADTVRCTHFVILSALWDANAALSSEQSSAFLPQVTPSETPTMGVSTALHQYAQYTAHETPDNGGTHQPVTDSHVNAFPDIRPCLLLVRH